MQKIVKFIGATTAQIAWGNNDNPNDILTIGGIYKVKSVRIHHWHRKLILEDIPELKFNSSSFEYVNQGTQLRSQ